MNDETDAPEGEDAAAEEDPWGDAMAEQEEVDGPPSRDEDPPVDAAPAAEKAELEQLTPSVSGEGEINLNAILDVPVTIAMEIGRTDVSIRNLLQLNQGSVVELDRMAGEALDVLVNGTLIAHGEVVVVNEKFGIRLTDVVSPSERIKKLG